jgi:ATP-binding cassette subfamily B protein
MTKPLPKKLAAFCLHCIFKQKWLFLFSQIGCLAWALDHTIWPLVYGKLIDTLTLYSDDRAGIFDSLAPILVGGVILWIIVDLGFRLGGILFARAIPQTEATIRMDLFDYVQHHSFQYFSDQFAGALTNKINDLPQAINRIIQLMMTLFIPALVAVAISTILFFKMQPIFAFMLGSWVVLHLSVCFYYAGRCDALAHNHAEARSSLSGKIVDSLSNHLNVKLFAQYDNETKYIQRYQQVEKEANYQALIFVEKIKIILALLSFIIPFAGLTYYMLASWQQNRITTGDVIFILNSVSNITIMVWLSGLELPNFFREIGVAKQALTLIQVPHEIVDAPDAKELLVTKGEITFDHVTFEYSKSKALFKDKNLIIRSGEKVGLVGSSGSGKTSFINLILRNFEVDSGRILIDGQDISKVTQNSLCKAIAMIPQEPVLFHRTLMENIRYGNPEATDEEVIAACEKAHCHEFIMKLPETYQTMVGERGLKLSGGQRQRIAIARALLKNAPILSLDEATSALDSVTERHIQHDLSELMRSRTAIVIAHRLSTISGLDRILVLDNGEVIEEGAHEELLLKNGSYNRMWQMQAGGFLPDTLEQEELVEE